MADVACLGILVADVLAHPVDAYPSRGELTLCERMRTSIGGCAANTSIGLQKLGMATSISGKVGGDAFGAMLRDTLHEHHLDTRGVLIDENAPTSATMVMVGSDGERSFIYCPGANGTFSPSDLDWNLLREAKLLHVAGHFLMHDFDGTPCAETLHRARALGLRTSLDTAWDASGRWMETLRPCLPHLDYFVPSYAEALRCARSVRPDAETPAEVARVFQDEGVGVVALKLGEGGSYIRAGQDEWHIPPYSVHAVDATGAGDAFAAGFLAGVLHGFDLPACGRLGNAVGACCVLQVGSIDGIRSLEDTLAFMDEHAKDAAASHLG